jgi:hypothetical protein
MCRVMSVYDLTVLIQKPPLSLHAKDSNFRLDFLNYWIHFPHSIILCIMDYIIICIIVLWNSKFIITLVAAVSRLWAKSTQNSQTFFICIVYIYHIYICVVNVWNTEILIVNVQTDKWLDYDLQRTERGRPSERTENSRTKLLKRKKYLVKRPQSGLNTKTYWLTVSRKVTLTLIYLF